MYFANASFIKDLLLTYIDDIAEANPTEYLVLEMTPVVSIDTAAIHSLQDIVHHFRSRGIQVAFAMVGNRVEKTMRKANMIEFVGEQWFFPTVNGAVHYCLQHQQCKKTGQIADLHMEGCVTSEVSKPVEVHPGNEIGFSNELHHQCTAIFINRLQDHLSQQDSIVGDVLTAFRNVGICVVKTQIESVNEGYEKHFYLVKDVHEGKKLSHARVEEVRKVLNSVFAFPDHESTCEGNSHEKVTCSSSEGGNSSCS
jgi:anti-anti-sigma regulatory factor